MKAAVFHAARDVRVENIDPPGDLGAGQVRIRPRYCGICGTDLHEYQQGPIVIPTAPHPLTAACGPQILGHEFSGEVLEVGSGVSSLSPGDRVSVMPLISCGECWPCSRSMNHLCVKMAAVGLSYAWGGMSEEVVVSASSVSRLHDSMSMAAGALVEPTAVAAYGVDQAGVRPGDVVVITGAGPIGVLAAMYAASLGARVVVSETNRRRREIAESLDIEIAIDPLAEDLEDRVRSLSDGVGACAAIECSGTEAALSSVLRSLRPSGIVTQTGLHTKPAAIDAMLLSERDLTIRGTWCFPTRDWPRIIRLIGAKGLPVERIVTSIVPLDDIVERGFIALNTPGHAEVKVLADLST